MFLRSIVIGAAAAALLAAPASAEVTLDPLKRCYVVAREDQREFVSINAHGFTKLTKVDLFIDEIQQPDNVQTLFDGSLSGTVLAPWVDSGQRVFTVRLAEEGKPENSVTGVSNVTRFSVEQVPRAAKTDDKVRFTGRGFTDAAPVYAHYVFNGKSSKTVTIGWPKGDCGTFNVRRKQFPFKQRPKVGLWTIQFDQLKDYNPQAAKQVPMTIRVKKAPKTRTKRTPARSH